MFLKSRASWRLLLLLIGFIILNIFAALPASAHPGDDDAAAELEKVINAELKETGTPGAAVAVIRDGRVIFSKGFGVASVETNAPVTPEMLFRLGSTTKMFTGAGVVTLAEQGKLKLDAPVGDYAKGLAPKLAHLTPHQLISNSAGVADFSPPFVSHDDAALATMVRGWKDDAALFGEPGKVYSYASPGFWLAGYVIEEVGGKPYADMMEELIFKPLGMTRTTFRPLTALTYPLALGHNADANGKPVIIRPAFNNVAMWPAGSIFSNVGELSRWCLALMSEGKLDGKQVISPTLFAKLSGKHILIPGETDSYYGYGLLNLEYRGTRLIMHGGFSRGYGSMIQMVPEQRFAVIVLTNKSGMTLNKTTTKAKELYLQLKPEPKDEPKKALSLTASDLTNFAGKYVNGPQTWEIYQKEGKLYLKDSDSEYALTKTGETRLSFGDSLENDVALVPGSGGRIEYIFTGLYSARRAE